MVTAKSGLTACARSTKRRTASYWLKASTDGRRARSGIGNGGERKLPFSVGVQRRPARGKHLDAGARASRSATTERGIDDAFEVVEDEKQVLSRQHRRQPVRTSTALLAHPEGTPAMAEGTSDGSSSVLRSTNQAPSGNASSRSAAACNARRVLPTPPGPVMVKSRTSSRLRRPTTRATCSSRPRNGVG